jgi:glycosyltransferase involved in cell wall biosynthesis
MIKVLYIVDSVNRGGAEILLLDVLRNARRHGIEPICVAGGGGDLEADFSHQDFNFICLRRKLPIDPAVVFKLRHLITEQNIDIVQVQQPVEALHAFLATRGLGTKLVFMHPGWFQGRKNYWALRLLAPRFDRNIVVSEDTKDRLIEQCRDGARLNLQLIPTAVDEKRLECATRNLRRELHLQDDDLLIGMIANFYPGVRKDHQTVCRAIAKLRATCPEAHVVFVGGKLPDASQVFDDCVNLCAELGISDRVHFVGKRADIPDVLNSLDLFLLSSLHEGLPVALVAAMIVGLPCVASDIAPHREISGDGKFIRLFKTGDPGSLATALVGLLNDRGSLQELGLAGRQYALREFSIDAHLAKLRQLYESLLR